MIEFWREMRVLTMHLFGARSGTGRRQPGQAATEVWRHQWPGERERERERERESGGRPGKTRLYPC